MQTFVFAEQHILLMRRGFPPYEGKWAPPGGFVEPFESAEAAAIRDADTAHTGAHRQLSSTWRLRRHHYLSRRTFFSQLLGLADLRQLQPLADGDGEGSADDISGKSLEPLGVWL